MLPADLPTFCLALLSIFSIHFLYAQSLHFSMSASTPKFLLFWWIRLYPHSFLLDQLRAFLFSLSGHSPSLHSFQASAACCYCWLEAGSSVHWHCGSYCFYPAIMILEPYSLWKCPAIFSLKYLVDFLRSKVHPPGYLSVSIEPPDCFITAALLLSIHFLTLPPNFQGSPLYFDNPIRYLFHSQAYFSIYRSTFCNWWAQFTSTWILL